MRYTAEKWNLCSLGLPKACLVKGPIFCVLLGNVFQKRIHFRKMKFTLKSSQNPETVPELLRNPVPGPHP